MSSLKNSLSGLLRKTGLIYAADYLRFIYQKLRNYNRNNQFRKEHPSFVLPPDYFLYETFTLDYNVYLDEGGSNAEEIIDTIRPLTDLSTPGKHILDWGCGPARVVRHLPALLSHNHFIYGTDYNKKYIDWCRSHLTDISFTANDLHPPLPFVAGLFDVIYSVSILTHLSEQSHHEWINEMQRVLKPGGILVISTQGNAYKDKMLTSEIIEFEKGNIVVRNFLKEGHRIFSAFQPESFMRSLFRSFEVIDHQKGDEGNSIHGKQDTWIVRKR
jgi:SAM-dependent methyltransferase